MFAEAFDEGETHVGHGSSTVEAAFLFHLYDEMLQGFFFILRELQGFKHNRVALNELRCGKAQRDVGALGVVFNEVHDAVEATVYGTAVVVLVAKVLTHRGFLVLCNVQGVVD